MRKRISKTAMFLTCFMVLAGLNALARVEASGHTAVGTWKLDVRQSSYHNMPAPRFEQLIITTDDPNATKWTLKGVGDDGKSYLYSYDGPIDGKQHPMLANGGPQSVAYTRTANGVQWTIKDKSGAIVERATGEVSPNGKVLTIKGISHGPAGDGSYTSVFLRLQ